MPGNEDIPTLLEMQESSKAHGPEMVPALGVVPAGGDIRLLYPRYLAQYGCEAPYPASE